MNNVAITLLAYIGPETMLPLASFFAAALGIILMFWKFIFRLIRRMFTAIFRLFFRKQKNKNANTSVPSNPEAKKVSD